MVRYCRLIAKGWRRDIFEGKNINKLRVYAIDDDSAVIEANWVGAGKPHDPKYYSYFDPAIHELDEGFYWVNLESIELVEVHENEDALFSLRSDDNPW